MVDVYGDLLDSVIGKDLESRDRFRIVQNKRAAGRRIYALRERLGLSCEEFAQVLGITDPAEVEDLELGNFPESGLEKFLEIRKAVKQYQLRLADISSRIRDIRQKVGMTPEDLAEYSRLPLETVKALEDAEYAGDWDAAIEGICVALSTWMNKVIVPTYLPEKAKQPRDHNEKELTALLETLRRKGIEVKSSAGVA